MPILMMIMITGQIRLKLPVEPILEMAADKPIDSDNDGDPDCLDPDDDNDGY